MLSLFAYDGVRDKHYLVAESFDFTDDEVRALQRHQISDSLAEHFRALMLHRHDSVLKNLAHHDSEAILALIDRNPVFAESNVAYQIYHSSHGYRVLLIYNARRMVDFVEKRQLNPNASGEEGLLHKPEALAFHVDPYAKEPWLTSLQDVPVLG